MTSLSLTDRVVTISGASAGIGAATARHFAAAGCRLALGARRLDRLEALRKSLGLTEDRLLISALDVQSAASCTDFVQQIHERFGGTDILINNAGLAVGLDPLSRTTDADAATVLDTNIMGVVRLTRDLLPRMLERGHGHIVMLGSIAGRYFYEGGAMYCASKHAIRAIAGALRLELCGQPVRITTIEPGMVETEFSEVRFGGDAVRAQQVYSGMTPLTADDIAEAIHWICTRPEHVVIDDLLITPRDQAYTVKVHRVTT